MAKLLDHLGTTITITPINGPEVIYTGDIKGWDFDGFQQNITSVPTMGTRYLKMDARSDGKVSFNFKFKNYDVGSTSPFALGYTVNSSGSMILDESTSRTPYKIVIKWTTGGESMIKAFYNAYGIHVTDAGEADALPTLDVEFMIPPFNEAGSSNFYQSNNLSHETTWDTKMGW